MGDSISKAFELEEEAKLKGMSDREIMDAKRPDEAEVRVFEKEYPALYNEFKSI